MKKLLISAGTRPNIIKITQFKKHAASFGLEVKILHTGQHYDHKMAQVFYDQFEVQPDFRQDLKPGTVLEQITQMMHNVTEIIDAYKPDVLLTPGDVNSTFAAAYAAYQAKVPVGHIESGLRSDDRSMPEEINRILTDDITDHFFITEKSGLENLKALGKSDAQLHMVGNTMIDTLVAFEPNIDQNDILKTLGVDGQYALFTFHRPGNVDDLNNLKKLVQLLSDASKRLKVVFPVHPRTIKMLEQAGLLADLKANTQIVLTDPLDYFSFQKLVKHASVVITDSGGIQEETTFRRVPCLTVRPNTERPSTVEIGSNTLLDFDVNDILAHLDRVLNGDYKKGQIPPLWDGAATQRILGTFGS
jgi:UDP-N-acetylglucosamine 2-epimerase (non-hydrolysing)